MTKKQRKLWHVVIFPIVYGLTWFGMTVLWDDKSYPEAFLYALAASIPGALVIFAMWYFSPESWWE